MRTFFLIFTIALLSNMNLLLAQTVENGRALIINTTSENEYEKVKAMLKSVDPQKYSITSNNPSKGRLITSTIGSVPISEVNKLKGRANLQVPNGAAEAGWTIHITLTSGGNSNAKLMDEILRGLDSQKSKGSIVNVKIKQGLIIDTNN
jgi:hypothetical protein